MRIQKKFQGKIPDNKILNMYSKSLTDTYSCDFINNIVGTGEITVVEQDPTVPEFIKNLTQDDIDRWNNNTGGIVNETDPVFIQSPAYNITQEDIEKWNSGTGGGITEEYDPTVPSHVKNITEEDINNWNNPTVGITEELDPTVPDFVKNITQEDIDNWNNNSNDLGITIEDINNWNNKQDQLVSGVNIKTIDGQSLLGSGNISTEYFAGKGIEIIDRTIINKITSYNDLTDLPFIPTKITDLIGGEDFPTDPENPDETGPWARVDKNNYFRTNQTIIGDVNADKLKAYSQMSVSELGFYLESDGSYTLGRVAE